MKILQTAVTILSATAAATGQALPPQGGGALQPVTAPMGAMAPKALPPAASPLPPVPAPAPVPSFPYLPPAPAPAPVVAVPTQPPPPHRHHRHHHHNPPAPLTPPTPDTPTTYIGNITVIEDGNGSGYNNTFLG